MILNLFCNWPMHIRIDRDPKNIRLFFDAFDFKDGMEVEEVLRSNYFKEFVLLNSFRHSLGEFLREHAVPDWLTNDTDNWHTFVYLYVGIVGPSPLVYTKDDILPSEVAELRVDRYKAANMDQEYVRAQVLLKNGQDYFSMHILPLKVSADWAYKYLRGRYPG